MLNFYEQISQNKLRSNLILTFFVGFILTASYFITYAFNLDQSFLLLAFGFSLVTSAASYFWGDKIVLGLNHARPATRKEFFNFYTVTENLSTAAQIPMPQLFIIDSPALNAFATGRDPQHAVVCATTGILEKFNRTELEGVIAHELSHIQNFDIRLMMIVSILIGSLSLLINLGMRSSIFGGGRDRDDNRGQAAFAIVGLIMVIFAPIIAQLVQLAISRRREFLADASSVKLTRQPNGLISALKKISHDPNIMKTASTATASLYISNPFKNNKVANLFSTHPPIADRIAALEQMM